jgi:hypothetical protein
MHTAGGSAPQQPRCAHWRPAKCHPMGQQQRPLSAHSWCQCAPLHGMHATVTVPSSCIARGSSLGTGHKAFRPKRLRAQSKEAHACSYMQCLSLAARAIALPVRLLGPLHLYRRVSAVGASFAQGRGVGLPERAGECLPQYSIGASSFSPSPMTTTPSISTWPNTERIMSTAACITPQLQPALQAANPRNGFFQGTQPMGVMAKLRPAALRRKTRTPRRGGLECTMCPANSVGMREPCAGPIARRQTSTNLLCISH